MRTSEPTGRYVEGKKHQLTDPRTALLYNVNPTLQRKYTPSAINFFVVGTVYSNATLAPGSASFLSPWMGSNVSCSTSSVLSRKDLSPANGLGSWLSRSSRTVSFEERSASMCVALNESLANGPDRDKCKAGYLCKLVDSRAYLGLAMALKASQPVKGQSWALAGSKVVEAR